ncbi:MAG: hypothetical protein AB7O47_10070 [Flavobacteriales bacterium]
MLKKLSILLLTFTLTIFSCKKATSPHFDAIVKSDKGVFRGVEIGSTIEDVQQLENKDFLVDNMPEYLYYDYNLDMGNSYTISYDFSQNSLYEIELSAYFDKIEDANNLFAELTKYFTNSYGAGKVAADGYTSWRTKSKKSGNGVEVAMINDSQEYGYVSILISDLNY